MVPFLVALGGISSSFGLAMGILARRSRAKIRSMARPNSPDMPPKRTKKVRLGISFTPCYYIRSREQAKLNMSAHCTVESYFSFNIRTLLRMYFKKSVEAEIEENDITEE